MIICVISTHHFHQKKRSVNEVICHGIPDKRALKEGDIVNLDISCYYNGFHGDMNATYCVGKVDEKGVQLVNTARECLEKANIPKSYIGKPECLSEQ